MRDILHEAYGDLCHVTNNVAAIKALEAGLNLCVQKGLSKIIIEGDSQIVINGIIKSYFHSWNLEKWLPRINQLLSSIGTYDINHVYKEGNRLADHLANLGVECNNEIVTFDKYLMTEIIIELSKMDSSREGID
ncbi:hypothetical protein SUGI_0767610 [Cryptomeria japonica]|nr:hypothetical protein SUGI_0767610 [Cryptomeria japonica]